ncbi:hypothetical protein NSR00_07055 [Aeribacillus sp. FSL K6-8394]|uniref:hypothetical protein n=1 Tax=Aeribacillus sp. FSL K6-8394 TaxID=2954570 RepID=UPI0030F651A6
MKELIRYSIRWSLGIAVITFVLAALFSIVSTVLLEGVGWAAGMMIVFVIVLIGIFFDMLGIAATSADEVPFHAMASKRVSGAKQAIQIIRNADRFSNFCNDVIGDISGIISGTASAVVVVQLAVTFADRQTSVLEFTISIVFTSIVAALTVGGKAFGKAFAIRFSTPIIFYVGKIFYFFEKRFNIVLMKEKKGKNHKKASISKKRK